MNIMTGNRLAELRKENKMSQDTLAEKLGLSRQAISKWERGESSPDTDNLIALASLYGLTLDELLNPNGASDSSAAADNSDTPSDATTDAIDKVANAVKSIKKPKKPALHGALGKSMMKFPFPIIIVIIYVLLGITQGIWHPLWIIFLLIPVYYHFAGGCFSRSYKGFMLAMPVPEIIVMIYLFIGFIIGEWVTSAVLFLVIPLYYWACATLIKKPKNQNTAKDTLEEIKK